MIRSFDPELAKNAAGYDPTKLDIDWQAWLDDHKNVMIVEGDNVGLATYEYLGVYTVHWFFTARGREALDLACQMLDKLFNITNAKVVRGLTPVDLKAARWLAKQVGMKSYGIETFSDGEECELMFLTKEEFYGHR